MTNYNKDGLVLLNKPIGMTSRQVLNHALKKIKVKTAGHTGTLDYYASGLLILLCGNSRKLQQAFTKYDKKYKTVICLGKWSQTDDAEGPLFLVDNPTIPTKQEIHEAIDLFTGQIEQTPPAYSAIKINGKRAYKLAREGKKVELKSRKINIYNIKLEKYEYPLLSLDIHCSSGTYIRSLARDIGTKLECGGYLQSLQRTQIKNFLLDKALTLEELGEDSIIPLENVLEQYPKISLQKDCWQKIRNGIKVEIRHELDPEEFAFIWIEDRVVALAKLAKNSVSSKKLLVHNLEK